MQDSRNEVYLLVSKYSHGSGQNAESLPSHNKILNLKIFSVGPPVDFFSFLNLMMLRHCTFIFCWNFDWYLKSILRPLPERCGDGAIHYVT